MITNVQYLFDPSKYEKVKTPEQQEFLENNKGLMFAMQEAVHGASEKYNKIIMPHFKDNEMDNKLPAVAMISFIKQYFIRNFSSYCRRASKSRFKLITPTDEYIYLKKLNCKKRPSNIETESNNLIVFQVTNSKTENFPNVFFGYTANKSKITGVYAVCIKGKELLWLINISKLSDSAGGIITSNTTPIKPVLKSGTVKLKKKDKNE